MYKETRKHRDLVKRESRERERVMIMIYNSFLSCNGGLHGFK